MEVEIAEAATCLTLMVVPGTAVIALLAPKAGWATRIALGAPAGALLLCVAQGAACAAGLAQFAPWTSWTLVAVGACVLALRARRFPSESAGIAWPIGAAVCCMLATWLLATSPWPTLATLPPKGSGVNADAMFHAACAAQFKFHFPGPDPTAEGFSQRAHFLLHLLVGAMSAATGRAPYDLVLHAVPLSFAAILGFQVAHFGRIAGLTPSWSAAASVAVFAGGNAAAVTSPWLGIHAPLNNFPPPTPLLLWKLPGLALSLIYALPAIALARRAAAMEQLGLKATGWMLLAVITCAGMCLAKPTVPIVLLGGLGVACTAGIVRSRTIDRGLVTFTAVLTVTFALAATMTYDARAYGYGQLPPEPFRSAAQALSINRSQAQWPLALTGALLLWMPLSWTCVGFAIWSAWKRPSQLSLMACAGSAVAGVILLITLFTPMNAEIQFALSGKFLGDFGGAVVLAATASRAMDRHRVGSLLIATTIGTIIAVPAALKVHLLFSRHAKTPITDAALTPEVAKAMEWLRDRSTPLQTVLVSSTTDSSIPMGAAECLGLAERQAYIANVRYSPGAYVALWKGEPAPLQDRIDEARAVFRAEPGAAARLAGRTRVRWAVLDRARGERFDEHALRAELGEPAFANARVAIWRIEPPATAGQEPKQP